MTRRELKEIIQECIDELNAESEYESIVEDIENSNDKDLLVEGAILTALGGIIFGFLAPYLILLAIILIIAPFVIMAGKIKQKKVDEILKTNPIVTKSITDFCNKTKVSFSKLCKDKAKYLVDNGDSHYFDKNNFKFNKDKDGKPGNNLYINILGIDGPHIIKDLYGTDDYNEYCKMIGWKNPDDYPPLKQEVKDILKVYKEAVKGFNSTLKSVSNSYTVKIEYNTGNFNVDDWTEQVGFYNSFFDDDIDGMITIEVRITFSDYKDIKVPEKYKAKFDGIVNTMRTKLKLK